MAYFAGYSCLGAWSEAKYREESKTRSIYSLEHSDYQSDNSVDSSLANLTYQFIIAKSRGRLYSQRICLSLLQVDNNTIGWTAGKDGCQRNGFPGSVIFKSLKRNKINCL